VVKISETFISPQGEGTTTGKMTLFIRVAGCNYANDGHPCKWCDTKYSWAIKSKKEISVDELNNSIKSVMMTSGLNHISLTGGEPLFYADELRNSIGWWSKRYHLVIETNGYYPIWREDCCWSVDMKCPASGNAGYNNYDILRMLSMKDQLKFVIADKEDFEFARDIVGITNITNIFFIPAFGILNHSTLIDWIKQDSTLCRMVTIGTQNHKYWYPKNKRGV
jgi:7-carboxy-7-deazaguanine synthase